MNRNKKKIHVAEVVRHDGPLALPEGLDYDDAINVLARQRDYEMQPIEIKEQIDCFPWEGAIALEEEIRERYGFSRVDARSVQTFFGPMEVLPEILSIEVGCDETRNVIWGNIALPGLPRDAGFAEMQRGVIAGRMCFALHISTLRKYESVWRDLVDSVKRRAVQQSLYKNKAFRICFNSPGGKPLRTPEIKFMRLTTVPSDLVFTRQLETAIATNLWTPLRYPDECRALGTPLKRGTLLCGSYGVGKTLLAHATASVAIEHGWTFIYLSRVQEITDAIRFAERYGRVVVFAEDIDRVTQGGRTQSLDEILNVIDGIDTKGTEVNVMLTTNHVGQIHEAMLRTGRLDVVLDIIPPDAEAAVRLVRLYGGALLDADADFSACGDLLAGNIPADIREVVERSKLAYLRRTGSIEGITLIPQDVMDAATDMNQQKSFIQKARAPKQQSNAELLEDSLAKAVIKEMNGDDSDTLSMLRGIGSKLDYLSDALT